MAKVAPLPKGRFRTILADPPWAYNNKYNGHGGAETHYRTMSIDEICALPVADHARRDAHLLMWTTWPMLRDGTPQRVMEAWGFRWASEFIWAKCQDDPIVLPSSKKTPHIIIQPTFPAGYRARKATEILMIGERGKPHYGFRESDGCRILMKDLRVIDLFFAKAGIHSAKPVDQYKLITRCFGGPYLELFARHAEPGWTVWGKEAPRKRKKVTR